MDSARRADASEREEAIAELARKAQQTNDNNDWYAVAMALLELKRFDEAISILDSVLNESPQEDAMRITLATAYSQTGQTNLCRFHLRYLLEHGRTEEIREMAREQLTGYEQFLGVTDADLKLRTLQLAALREAISREGSPAEDFLHLARLLRHGETIGQIANGIEESRAVLEAGIRQHPQSVPLLEHLVPAYLQHDPQKRLDETLRSLERLAPDSQIFKVLADLSPGDTADWSQGMSERIDHLFKQVTSDDTTLREPALAEIRAIVQQYPQNTHYRLMYAFALMATGDQPEVTRQAHLLDEVASDSHSFHFNLGQVFYYCGDRVKGRAHLELAAQYAANEKERGETWELMSNLDET